MTWTPETIVSLVEALRVHRGDSTTVEVKRATGGLPQNLDRSICAFANMPAGGTVLLGVDDNHGFALSGVDDPASLEAALVDQARSRVVPVPGIRTETVTVNGTQIVVVEVASLRLADKPATVDGQAYLRQADGDYAMHEHELRMLEVEKLLLVHEQDYDRQPVTGLTRDDLVPEIVAGYLANARRRDKRLAQRTDTEILRWTGVLLATGEPTLAGLYAMGDYPQGPFPSLTVTAAVQAAGVPSGARTRDLQHFTGPIPVLLDDVMAWCERNIPAVRAYRPDGHMQERPELPLSAVRELVGNALVHRDLSPNTVGTGKSIQIRMTPTSLMILSPGGLRGVSLQQLENEDHAQAAVNQSLYGITQKLTTSDGLPIIEGEGGGLREVFRGAQAAGLRRPLLINTGVQFKALLWRAEGGSSAPSAVESDAAWAPADSPDAVPSPAPHRDVEEIERSSAPASVESQYRLRPDATRNEAVIVKALREAGAGPASASGLSIRELHDATGLSIGQLRYALGSAVAAGVVNMEGGQGKKRTVYRVL